MSETNNTKAADSKEQTEPSSETDKRQRVYQISANRGRASHKLRYVESSSAETGDCRLCVGALSPEDVPTDNVERDNDKEQ